MAADTSYVGPMEFDLVTGKGTPVARVDVSVHQDVVLFHVVSSEMGRISRHELATWLRHPAGDLPVGYLRFSHLEQRVQVSVDGSAPYRLTAEFITDLLRVL